VGKRLCSLWPVATAAAIAAIALSACAALAGGFRCDVSEPDHEAERHTAEV
jgi:hypothetical protein